MNGAPQPQGIHISSKTIGMAVGIISIIGSMFVVVDKINSYETRLDRIEFTEGVRIKELENLAKEIKFLNGKITDLTIEIREFRATNEANKNK